MYDFFVASMKLALENWQSVVIGGAVVIFTLVCFIGILKPLLFNKIKNKAIRKTALAFTSVALIFPFTALWFLFNHIDFKYYLMACVGGIPATIVIYWLYENTNLRSLIQLIGKNTFYKFSVYFAKNLVKQDAIDKKENALSGVNDYKKLVAMEIKKEVENNITPVDKDDELKNL